MSYSKKLHRLNLSYLKHHTYIGFFYVKIFHRLRFSTQNYQIFYAKTPYNHIFPTLRLDWILLTIIPTTDIICSYTIQQTHTSLTTQRYRTQINSLNLRHPPENTYSALRHRVYTNFPNATTHIDQLSWSFSSETCSPTWNAIICHSNYFSPNAAG